MKIKYKRKRINYNLIFGILYSAIGIIAMFDESPIFINYLWFVLGGLYIVTYIFELTKQYLTIENGIIIRNTLKPKSIKLSEITEIKKIAGDYILKSDAKDFRINTSIIEEQSLNELDLVLNKLKLTSF